MLRWKMDDYPCEYSSTMEPIKLYEDMIRTNNIIELVGIQGGENLVFFDMTARTVDIGLYAEPVGPQTQNIVSKSLLPTDVVPR